MGIKVENQLRAHLYTDTMSYIIEVFEGELLHGYWGKRLEPVPGQMMAQVEEFASFYPNPNGDNKTYSLQALPREFPDFGRSDYRNPMVRLRLSDGSAITKFVVIDMQVQGGKPDLEALPSNYSQKGDDWETLVIKLLDEKSQVEVACYYSVSNHYNVLTRHVVYENLGEDPVFLEAALSANVDFYNDNDFDLIHFPGSWARERDIQRIPVGRGSQVIESRRGSSSHQQNPMLILARPYSNDLKGEVYGMNFVYSGSFKGVIEVNSFDTTRFQMGLNDFDFKWKLCPKLSFTTPEVVMVYSDQGFNGMSNVYHKLYRERLMKGKYRDRLRPVLINNWEATYFSFTEDKLKAIGDAAAETGMELFVLDDGWFGLRNSDKSGLGDWFVNKDKLKNGLMGVADYMLNKDLMFGLWFEPEMVSQDSDLYREHPDWVLHAPGHTRSQGRNQLVLDFSRRDVQDYIIDVVGKILRDHPITYVKWDMNRNMTEVNSALLPHDRQGEVTHGYILGLYRVLNKLTKEFTHILFESCSGGGGRFDPGMLYYMPQTWTSDDTDAHERLSIQYGTSFAYPPIAMGAHVSVAPNHQVGRWTSLSRRAMTSMMANLGYELDLSALNEAEKEEVIKQVAYYKSIRKDIQFGNFYRLLPPNSKHGCAFLTESPDRKRYYLFYFRELNKPHQPKYTLPLSYLSEGEYTIEEISFSDCCNGILDANGQELEQHLGDSLYDLEGKYFSASYLNNYGFTFNRQSSDFDSQLLVFSKKS